MNLLSHIELLLIVMMTRRPGLALYFRIPKINIQASLNYTQSTHAYNLLKILQQHCLYFSIAVTNSTSINNLFHFI